jgi:hypothetical protein
MTEPNDDSHDSGSVDEESDEAPEASIEAGTNLVAPLTSVPKSAVKVARNSKRGVPKTTAQGSTQKRGTANAAPRKKQAGKQIQGATLVDDDEPNDDCHESGSVDEKSDEDPARL